MELSINQLADLKIAIEKESQKLEALKNDYNKLKPEYDHTQAENTRLVKEVSQQAQMKNDLINENTKLREEKDVINGEYEKKAEENYKKLEKLQKEIDEKQELLNLRTLEVEKRERDIFNKNKENENTLKEINKIKGEIGQERIYLEKSIQENEIKIKALTEKIKIKNDITKELEEKELKIISEQNKLNAKSFEVNQEIVKNQEILIEIKAKEEIIKEAENDLDKFTNYLKEVKNFTLKNINENFTDKLEQNFKFIEDSILNGNKEDIIDEKNVDNLTAKQIRQLLTKKGIEFNKNNFTKNSLIKLLK